MSSLIFAALIPIIIVLVYVYKHDKYEKEPIWLISLCIIGGVLSVYPILFLEKKLSIPMDQMTGYTKAAWNAFVVAGFSEEFFKYLFVMLIVWRNRHFNEKFDGIVYAVSVSMGFAGVENILYVLHGGFETAYLRSYSAIPGHAVFGIAMGYYLGNAKMLHYNKLLNLILSLIIPVLFHGIYDFILMSKMPYYNIFFSLFVGYIYIFGFSTIDRQIIRSRFRSVKPSSRDDNLQ